MRFGEMFPRVDLTSMNSIYNKPYKTQNWKMRLVRLLNYLSIAFKNQRFLLKSAT